MPVLTAHQTTLPVDRVAVGIARRSAEHADRARELVNSQHPVVRMSLNSR